MTPSKKIALVTDWYDVYAGSERVEEQILNVFPEADVFSLVDHLPDEIRGFLGGRKVHTSFIQKLPFSKNHFRSYLFLMPIAIEQFNLREYDLIISSSHAVSKGVICGPDQLHICYCHTPMRYAWDMNKEYMQRAGLNRGLKKIAAQLLFHYLRIWDAGSASRVNLFLANSHFTARRIYQTYHRQAEVIYPPVDIEKFTFYPKKKDYYFTAGRMVAYKQTEAIVRAFSQIPDRKLVVAGDGPEMNKIQSIAGNNIQFIGHVSSKELIPHMQEARAFIFAAEEDFGITPVEAQSCGTPVIAYGRGGATETIRGLKHESPTGHFFEEQTPAAILKAVKEFEENESKIEYIVCHENAARFTQDNFKKQFKEFVKKNLDENQFQSPV